MTTTARPRTLIFAVGAAALALGAGLVAWQLQAGAQDPEPYREAILELSDDPSAVAATVNGRPIPAAKLDAFAVLQRAGSTFGEGAAATMTPDEVLDQLIENELMFQEAERRGLVPSQDEVVAYARETEEGLKAVMAEDSDDGKRVRDLFEQVRGTDYWIDNYDSSPLLLDGFRRTMAIGKLRVEVESEVPMADRENRDKVVAHVDSFVDELRAAATIEIAAP
ncbi:MAG: SurA N-terminal domain-containing protein [Dehalococcoidia bacterium]|nr:SurA N-terminal domain-containing protein [Dehalococcoidia bacterium]